MSFSAAGAPLCCHQLKLFPDGRNYPKSRKMFPNMPVLCLGCQSYSVTASLFCHILPQRHIQNNHREQVPAPKNWFQRHKVLEVVEHRVVWFPNPLAAGSQMGTLSRHRATILQENNCHHQQSKTPSPTLRSTQHCRHTLWKYDS